MVAAAFIGLIVGLLFGWAAAKLRRPHAPPAPKEPRKQSRWKERLDELQREQQQRSK
jgi:uncharacterized membrane-anchored protein YhcB (DUF1043 family)